MKHRRGVYHEFETCFFFGRGEGSVGFSSNQRVPPTNDTSMIHVFERATLDFNKGGNNLEGPCLSLGIWFQTTAFLAHEVPGRHPTLSGSTLGQTPLMVTWDGAMDL